MKIRRNISILFFTIFMIFSCGSNNNLSNKNNTVTEFLRDITSLKNDTNTNPIIAFQKLAEELAVNKIIFKQKNIKEVLIKSRDYSSSVITVSNHTIVKIDSIDDCQQSGSWKACMPFVKGYVKKGKLNYKADYMNNVIGMPDSQERIAYFFDNVKSNLKNTSDALEQTPYSSYYKNGNLKVTGQGFDKFEKVISDKKDGLSLMESADLNSKQIANIPFGTDVFVKSIEGEWANVKTEFYLNPGDDGYFIDLIEPSTVEGYVLEGFLETKQDSIKKAGVWTYFYESKVKKKEEYYSAWRLIKKIDYNRAGDVVQIEEYRNDDLWNGLISVSFYNNGKIKSKTDAEDGGAVQITFDENGNIIDDGYGSDKMKGYFDEIILSIDIRDFYLPENKLFNKEINP